MAKLANAKGEMVYFNLVQKNGKLQWVIKGIGDTVVLGRDRQKKKSRTFTQEAQALHPGSPGGCLSEAQRVHDQPLLKGRSR